MTEEELGGRLVGDDELAAAEISGVPDAELDGAESTPGGKEGKVLEAVISGTFDSVETESEFGDSGEFAADELAVASGTEDGLLAAIWGGIMARQAITPPTPNVTSTNRAPPPIPTQSQVDKPDRARP